MLSVSDLVGAQSSIQVVIRAVKHLRTDSIKLEIHTDSQYGALCAYAREQDHGRCHQPPELEA